MVSASVSTLKGGSANLATIWRSKRLGEIAIENGLPNVTLLQSVTKKVYQVFFLKNPFLGRSKLDSTI